MPEFVYIGWRRFRVALYIPEPIRCYHCQSYGHKAIRCNSRLRCPICSKNHSFDHCPNKNENKENRRAVCPNCNNNHPASYKGCTKYQGAKSIMRIQTTGKQTYAEAAKTFRSENKNIDRNKQPNFMKTSEGQLAKGNNNTLRSCTNSNGTKPGEHPRPSVEGNIINSQADNEKHKQCGNVINVEILVNFAQSIGSLLRKMNANDELIRNVDQIVENFIATIKQSQTDDTANVLN